MDTEKTVSEIMTKEVITVHSDDAILKVRDIFEENPIHHIIVCEKDGVCGIISKNDILRLLMKSNTERSEVSLAHLKVKEVMTANPLTIESDDTLGLAADIILSNRLHSLPVLEDGDLVGILTNHDLLKYCFK